MHRRPTLTQRQGLFRSTRFILYGRRVRVIRNTPLVREDQYIPLDAVDPDARVVRTPQLRTAAIGLGLALPGLALLAGWPAAVESATRLAAGAGVLLGAAVLAVRGVRGRTCVHHGALSFDADEPDAAAFRHFEARLVEATRQELALAGSRAGGSGPVSVATEIRRLHGHARDGLLSGDEFQRHKQRLLRRLAETPR